MRLLLLPLLLCAAALSAQRIDTEHSRFLSAPNGRTGTYAPFRVVLTGLKGNDTVTLSSISRGVVLHRQLAVAGKDTAEAVIPLLVADDTRVRVRGKTSDEFAPELPMRRVEPDYARPYVAVFSPDPVYARGLLPSVPDQAICDYFELSEFFTDWRLLDGYDAIVVFNPGDLRLPPGSSRAIAEFCSLGGAAVIAGSFRFGEKAVNLPAPADPRVLTFRGVLAQRFGYGPGAIYRFEADELRRSRSARLALVDALRDQAWFHGGRAPGGKPPSHLAPAQPPIPKPLPPAEATPGPLFWGLAGGLLLLCALLPAVAGRYLKAAWPVHLALLACCAGVGGAALLQDRPLPTVEVSALVQTGGGKAASVRFFVAGEDSWRDTLEVNLDDDAYRGLPRYLPIRPGWNAWLIDQPLLTRPVDRAPAVELSHGMVDGLSFRDYGTKARRGRTEFSTSDAYLVDWWLETNAWRGRSARLAPVEWPAGAISFRDGRLVRRGAIRVTSLREAG